MKKNNLKKNFVAIVAIVLMIGLIAGMGAFTYSKYVTSESGDGTATAAKWGYVISIDSNDLFGKNYTYNSESQISKIVTSNGVAVKGSANGGNVVAPGTTGSLTITVNGSAEVLSKLSFEGNETAIKCGTYQPVKWSVKIGNAEKEACASYAEVITKLNESNAEFNAGDTINNTYVISWEWALETAKDTSDNYNIEDTCIGYKANGTEFTNLPGKISGISQTTYDSIVSTMTIDLIVKVEQIQVKATN